MSRTLLIGLDGATFTVLDPLLQSGVMPCLRRLVERGTRGHLLSTVQPVTCQAWPSLVTGRSPGHHGVFDFVRFEERPHGAYFTVTSSRDLCCETLWSMVSRQGRRVTSLNFYGMSPPEPVNGHLVSGFVTWRHLKSAVYPRDLYPRLLALPGFDRKELAMDLDLEKKCIQGLPHEQYEDWIRLHIRREERWAQILGHLMASEPSDLTAVVFDGVDKIQHLCWRFLDPGLAPPAPTGWERRVRDLCHEYFRRLDDLIAAIVAAAGEDCRTFFASDHGFGPTSEIFYVNVLLHRLGHLQWTADAEPDEDDRLTSDRATSHVGLIDWPRTSAFSLTPSSNGVYIRTSINGERPGGIRPADYEAYRRRLTQDLLGFRDPATGEPVVTRVLNREEAYPGGAGHCAPDLLLTLRDGGFVSILNSQEPLRPRPEPMGTHRPEGIFVASGPDIQQGRSVPPLSILDVAPALLYSLGLAIPSDLEGELPAGIFTPELLAAEPARRTAATGCRAVIDDGETADSVDEAEIMDRLKALGYLE